MGSTPGGYQFYLSVRGLSGPVSGVHIHGPASASENGPVMATLCGGPPPAAVATCDVVDGTLMVSGEISGLQPGVSPAQFIAALESGMTYVNVHTALNPAGETHGQIAGS